MSRQSLEQNDTPDSGDALSLFGHESQRPSSSSDGPSVSSDAPIESSEGGGISADSADAISLNSIISTASLRFVEGVALVQALSAAAKEKGGMPNLDGVFLKNTGEVVVVGPPSVEPAARELARLLHRLVPAESTPPVGRLFVDRWATGASTDLTEFTSELAYFARPNGREIVSAIHARSAGKPAGSAPAAPLPVPPAARTADVPRSVVQAAAPPPPREPVVASWLRSHRRQIVVAAAMIVLTVGATGLVTWFWPSKTAEAAQARASSGSSESSAPAVAADAAAKGETAKEKGEKTSSKDSVATKRLSAAPPTQIARRVASAPSLPGEKSRPAAITPPAPVVTADVAAVATPAALPTRAVPDMRIYSAADAGIEPPKLRSAEIPEFLIAGFARRANSVEVIVNALGSVERVRMLGTPQRIPDIMLLSRVKEWMFDPATRDGAAVRYRMVLSWNVTP